MMSVRGRIGVLLALAAVLSIPQAGSAQCAGIREEGRWRNLDAGGDPSYIDVKMHGGCGDEVLNGESTGSSPSYTIRDWYIKS